jgi:hypothetical protein
MYIGINAYNGVETFGVIACVYFLILFITGNCESFMNHLMKFTPMLGRYEQIFS